MIDPGFLDVYVEYQDRDGSVGVILRGDQLLVTAVLKEQLAEDVNEELERLKENEND